MSLSPPRRALVGVPVHVADALSARRHDDHDGRPVGERDRRRSSCTLGDSVAVPVDTDGATVTDVGEPTPWSVVRDADTQPRLSDCSVVG